MPINSILVLYAEALNKISRLEELNATATSYARKVEAELSQVGSYLVNLEARLKKLDPD